MNNIPSLDTIKTDFLDTFKSLLKTYFPKITKDNLYSVLNDKIAHIDLNDEQISLLNSSETNNVIFRLNIYIYLILMCINSNSFYSDFFIYPQESIFNEENKITLDDFTVNKINQHLYTNIPLLNRKYTPNNVVLLHYLFHSENIAANKTMTFTKIKQLPSNVILCYTTPVNRLFQKGNEQVFFDIISSLNTYIQNKTEINLFNLLKQIINIDCFSESNFFLPGQTYIDSILSTEPNSIIGVYNFKYRNSDTIRTKNSNKPYFNEPFLLSSLIDSYNTEPDTKMQIIFVSCCRGCSINEDQLTEKIYVYEKFFNIYNSLIINKLANSQEKLEINSSCTNKTRDMFKKKKNTFYINKFLFKNESLSPRNKHSITNYFREFNKIQFIEDNLDRAEKFYKFLYSDTSRLILKNIDIDLMRKIFLQYTDDNDDSFFAKDLEIIESHIDSSKENIQNIYNSIPFEECCFNILVLFIIEQTILSREDLIIFFIEDIFNSLLHYLPPLKVIITISIIFFKILYLLYEKEIIKFNLEDALFNNILLLVIKQDNLLAPCIISNFLHIFGTSVIISENTNKCIQELLKSSEEQVSITNDTIITSVLAKKNLDFNDNLIKYIQDISTEGLTYTPIRAFNKVSVKNGGFNKYNKKTKKNIKKYSNKKKYNTHKK